MAANATKAKMTHFNPQSSNNPQKDRQGQQQAVEHTLLLNNDIIVIFY